MKLSPVTASLWAKSDPRHPLWCHLLDIAAVARALLPRFWPQPPIPLEWILFLVALHDIGKADALFQSKSPESIEAVVRRLGLLEGVVQTEVVGFRHEARSAEWVKRFLTRLGWPREVVSVVVAALRGHHGDFHPKWTADDFESDWNPLRIELAKMLAEVLKPDLLYVPEVFADSSEVGLKLSGLIVLSDWIASGTHPYDYPSLEQGGGPAVYFELACERAVHVVKNLALTEDTQEFLEQPLKFSEVWTDIPTLRPSQQTLQDCVLEGVKPGLMILEAPMGEGKTEGAVYLAQEWNRQRGSSGVYIALPTMATSNQMHRRYAKYLNGRTFKGVHPRLIHGMAWLIGDNLPDAPETDAGDDPREAARVRAWFASAKRALLASEAVGTVDQALYGALKVKHGFLRLFGLSPRVLVIDEVHAYDAFMQTILKRLLEWCHALKIPVILLSATLSKTQKVGLIAAYTSQTFEPAKEEPYPLLTFAPLEGKVFTRPVTGVYTQKTIVLEREPGLLHDSEATAARAAELVKNGGCICVLVNTVHRAQEVFRTLEAMKNAGRLDSELFLFHARFTAGRRDEIEQQEVMKSFGPDDDRDRVNPHRPHCAILVATQVVEQSLDVCFDAMLTDLAPMDLLLQRAGRLHRHAVNPRYSHIQPRLHVLLPTLEQPFDFGRIELKCGKGGQWRGVYDRFTLLKTLVLLERDSISLPRDFRDLVESVYGDLPLKTTVVLEAEIVQAESARTRRTAEFEQLGKEHLIPPPDLEEFTYAQAKGPLDEDEDGKRSSYFRAQTRLGDDTRAVILLTDPTHIKAFRTEIGKSEQAKQKKERYQPNRDFLVKLFLQKVNLPGYWMQAEPLEGQEEFMEKGPGWLRHHTVIFAPQGQWQGTLNSKSVVIRVDRTLGILLENPLEVAPMETEGIEAP